MFDAYGVDLVVAGHEHHYERTFPVRGDLATPFGFASFDVAPTEPGGTTSITATYYGAAAGSPVYAPLDRASCASRSGWPGAPGPGSW